MFSKTVVLVQQKQQLAFFPTNYATVACACASFASLLTRVVTRVKTSRDEQKQTDAGSANVSYTLSAGDGNDGEDGHNTSNVQK